MNIGLVAGIVLALPLAASGKLLPETAKFADCVLLADWTLEAGEALRAGAPLEHGNQPPARRAAIEAVYRSESSETEFRQQLLVDCLSR